MPRQTRSPEARLSSANLGSYAPRTERTQRFEWVLMTMGPAGVEPATSRSRIDHSASCVTDPDWRARSRQAVGIPRGSTRSSHRRARRRPTMWNAIGTRSSRGRSRTHVGRLTAASLTTRPLGKGPACLLIGTPTSERRQTQTGEWTGEGSNLRPLACHASALPLSYRSWLWARRRLLGVVHASLAR